MADDYLYDVFISYKRHNLTICWVDGVIERLAFWLTQELGGQEAKLFFDKESIEVGDPWPAKIQEGLRTSRCMVGIWSPQYFQSRWCVSEWRSFLERGQRLGKNLIAPVRFHDGESYPQEAKDIQQIDVTPYTSTLDGFWKTDRAVELEDKLKELAKALAKIVSSATPFEQDWPIVNAEGNPPPKAPLVRL